MLTLLLLGHFSAALAEEAAVYEEGTTEAAAARLEAVVGASPELVVSFADVLVGRSPALTGSGELSRCLQAPSSLLAVTRSLDAAEAALKQANWVDAQALVGVALRGLGCLDGPGDPEIAARTWLTLGAIRHGTGDATGAREAFREATVLDPRVAWDDALPASARTLFEETAAAAPAKRVTITMVPEAPLGSVRLDGRPVVVPEGKLETTEGTHYVQLSSPTFLTLTVTVRGPSTLVLPGFMASDSLSWVAEPARRDALAAVLTGAMGRDNVIYVLTGGDVWRLSGGGTTWDLLVPGRPIPPPAPKPVVAPGPVAAQPPSPPAPLATAPTSSAPPAPLAAAPPASASTAEVTRERSRAGPVMLGVGGVGLLAGGIVAGMARGDAMEAYDAAVQEGRTDAGDAAFEAAAKRYGAGIVIAGLGAAVATGGLVVTVAF